MAKLWAKSFYTGTRWQACRAAYIASRRAIDGGMCEVCKERLGVIVHHKKMLTAANIKDSEIAYGKGNLRLECKQCHDEEEGHYLDAKGIKRPLASFDSEGNPIDRRLPP